MNPSEEKTELRTVERPILFSGPMVRAILEGRKTQTRRVIKQQPEPYSWSNGRQFAFVRPEPGYLAVGIDCLDCARFCHIGSVGTRLWVKEAFMPMPHLNAGAFYRASDPLVGGRWKPSIFMPRKLSRITLEIISIRVEQLQDISEDDAQAEGAERDWTPEEDDRWMCTSEELAAGYQPPRSYSAGFENLWRDINGKKSWDANPFVWVIGFRILAALNAIKANQEKKS